MKDNPFLVQNLFYNIQQDFYVCPMGQRMENIGSGKRTSANGYESQVSYYQAKRCDGCPLRSLCHKAKGNRTIEVNHRLNQLRAQSQRAAHERKRTRTPKQTPNRS